MVDLLSWHVIAGVTALLFAVISVLIVVVRRSILDQVMSANLQKIKLLQTSVAGLRQDITALQGKSALAATQASLNASTTASQNVIDALKTTMKTQNTAQSTDMVSLKATVATLQNTVKTNATVHAASQATHATGIASLNANVTALEATIKANATVQATQATQVATQNTALAALQTALASQLTAHNGLKERISTALEPSIDAMHESINNVDSLCDRIALIAKTETEHQAQGASLQTKCDDLEKCQETHASRLSTLYADSLTQKTLIETLNTKEEDQVRRITELELFFELKLGQLITKDLRPKIEEITKNCNVKIEALGLRAERIAELAADQRQLKADNEQLRANVAHIMASLALLEAENRQFREINASLRQRLE